MVHPVSGGRSLKCPKPVRSSKGWVVLVLAEPPIRGVRAVTSYRLHHLTPLARGSPL